MGLVILTLLGLKYLPAWVKLVWLFQIPHILIRVINTITLSDNKEELRSAINKIAEETELDKFFAYGYGAHHFWLKHRKLSNGEPKEYRLLKVEF